MSMTRRFYIFGLASMLSNIRMSDLSAKVKLDPSIGFQEDTKFYDRDNNFDAWIEYLEVGECPDMRGGPALKSGWYLHPVCNVPGCCDSEGPFETREEALEFDDIRWDKLSRVWEENRQSRRKENMRMWFDD